MLPLTNNKCQTNYLSARCLTNIPHRKKYIIQKSNQNDYCRERFTKDSEYGGISYICNAFLDSSSTWKGKNYNLKVPKYFSNVQGVFIPNL